jgi:hypothetical protein
MPLKGGKEYLKFYFKTEQQPFKMVLLSENIPERKYDVSIDFDESSRAWRKNKIHIGEGHFIYKRYSERIFKSGERES